MGRWVHPHRETPPRDGRERPPLYRGRARPFAADAASSSAPPPSRRSRPTANARTRSASRALASATITASPSPRRRRPAAPNGMDSSGGLTHTEGGAIDRQGEANVAEGRILAVDQRLLETARQYKSELLARMFAVSSSAAQAEPVGNVIPTGSNVVGVGYGAKVTAGAGVSDGPAVRVYVRAKVPVASLPNPSRSRRR